MTIANDSREIYAGITNRNTTSTLGEESWYEDSSAIRDLQQVPRHRSMGRIPIVGRNAGCTMYTPLDRHPPPSPPLLDHDGLVWRITSLIMGTLSFIK